MGVEREAEAAAASPASTSVEVVDGSGRANGRPCSVAECDRRGLEACASSHRPLPVGTAITIGRSDCRGLAAAHAVGVVHRDLSHPSVPLSVRRAGCKSKLLDFRRRQSRRARDLRETGGGRRLRRRTWSRAGARLGQRRRKRRHLRVGAVPYVSYGSAPFVDEIQRPSSSRF